MWSRCRPLPRVLACSVVMAQLVAGAACWRMQGSSGGGQTAFEPPRQIAPGDVAVPAGYRVERVASGLVFPTGVSFDAQGRVHVVESGYSYGEVWTTPRLLRIDADGRSHVVTNGTGGPWNGVAHAAGAFYVAEGGQREGGRILRIAADGATTVVADGLPSLGDHHTNGPVVGSDGWLYFGQGSATNSAVVGLDNAAFGWLQRHPRFHDTPCQDVRLAGRNFDTPPSPSADDPVTATPALTGAFVPFGTPTTAGQVVRGQVPCSGAILRVRTTGGPVELVAWGFRNPFGLAFTPDGALYATDNSYDSRGSRPVFGAGDLLWRITAGAWYGWPDFHGDRPLTDRDHYRAPGRDAPGFVLAEHPNVPPRPAAVLDVHSSSNGFDFSRDPRFGHVGDAFIAQFGDMAPDVGKVLAPVGYKVVRVDPRTGVVQDFAVNRAASGPASRVGGSGLERPVAARFSPDGLSLYVVDFGVMTVGPTGPEPRPGTGVLWRIWREGGSR